MKRIIFCFTLIAMLLIPLVVSADPTPSPAPTPAVEEKEDNSIWILSGLKDVVDSILDLPGRIISDGLTKLAEILNKGMSTAIINNLRFYLSIFTDFLEGGDDNIFRDPTVNAVSDVMKPVAYSIITILFLIGISKATINLEVVSTEIAVKYGLMLVITKIFVDNTSWVLKMICGANNFLTLKILDMTSVNVENLYDVSRAWNDGLAPTATIDAEIGLSVLFLVFAMVALLAAIAMFIVLILRQIHLAVMICVAPLFFATMIVDVSNFVFRNFLMHFIAAVFQTTFMAVALAIFCGSIQSYLSGTVLGISGGFVGMCIGIIALSFYMVKTPNTINQILGAHGHGGGINVASIAALFARV